MKGLIKLLATVSAVFAIISCLMIVAVADEIVVDDSEMISPDVSDELLAICSSTPSDSVYSTYNIATDHPWWCRGYSGEIFQADQYYLDCYCVDHAITSSVSVHVYYTTENLSVDDVSETNQIFRSAFPNVKFISNASEDYNCHSYAWYSQDVLSNNYWMDKPNPYYENTNLYDEVLVPQVGDIICYFYADDLDDNIHSGIIVSVGSSANTHVVQSKWGIAGLYEHYAADCLYPLMGATQVKYYSLANHEHTFAKSNYEPNWHKKYCTDCGVIIWEEHDYTILSTKNSTSHTVSCACGASKTASHSFGYQTYSENIHKKSCACGYATYVAHDYEYSYTNAQVHTKTCNLCDASYQDPHYEEAYSVEDNGDGSHDITCICEGIFEEDASHDYNEYGYYNGVYHKISCICGDYELEAHDMEYNSLDNSYHWEECWICGYENEVEHVYTASNTYYDLNHHKSFCACSNYEIALHDEYTIKSSNTVMHTLQLSCCGNRTVTNWHTYEEYDADSHTGDCTFCNYTLTVDQVHTENYMDNGNGTHTNKCHHCGYTHTTWHDYTYYALNEETHQRYCTKCDLEQIVEDHTWDDAFDEDGNWYPFCTGCGYELDVEWFSLNMISDLPMETQNALQSATQNALLNATEDQTAMVIVKIDDETGILYYNGEYYLVHYPTIPDAEISPAPSVPSEESVS